MGVFPVTVIRRQIPLGRAGADYPEHGVDEEAVVLGWTTYASSASGQQWRKDFPYSIGYVVTAVARQLHPVVVIPVSDNLKLKTFGNKFR